ncbi:hypothetical protein AX774_g2106, partial [Zancudomyces culisetae]
MFCIPKKNGNATSLGLMTAEPDRGQAKVQDGVPVQHMPAGQERRLHDVAGPPRCVPAHQDRGEVSKALEILLEGGALSIQGAPFWPDGITIRFHEGGQTNNSLGKEFRNPRSGIPRRLDHSRT